MTNTIVPNPLEISQPDSDVWPGALLCSYVSLEEARTLLRDGLNVTILDPDVDQEILNAKLGRRGQVVLLDCSEGQLVGRGQP